MNTAKKYKDVEGNEYSIKEMIKREPEWAANIIQFYEDKTEQLESENAAMEVQHTEDVTEIARLKSENAAFKSEALGLCETIDDVNTENAALNKSLTEANAIIVTILILPEIPRGDIEKAAMAYLRN
jgi:hypothetical protein